ncbi:uncharacterized protein LOC143020157 [Oratosquilla oratoria]|uniref:uncharacterized protein LOC143020157 n=1 Tax=Oratosquilla oratoria TaxID=337810 RepID=UPI003F75B9B0
MSGFRQNITNLSSVTLTKHEHEVLGLGVGFALKPDNNHVLDYIVGFDRFIASNDYDKDLHCLKGVLLQGIADCFKQDRGLPKRLKQAVESLSNYNNIIISRADKGGKLVLLDQCDYEAKALDLLTDRDTYELLTKKSP